METDALPIGPALQWRPVPPPQKKILEGRYVRLEPVDPQRHADDLFALSAGRDDIWTYLGYGPFADMAAFRAWLTECARQTDPLFVAIIDKASGRAAGMASYLRIAPANGVIEIGHIWFAPALQRTRRGDRGDLPADARRLRRLGYRRLEWKCDSLNAPRGAPPSASASPSRASSAST